MIKRFSVFYVGQIDLDNVGKDGTLPEDRWYDNEELLQAYYNAEELAKHLDALDYYAMWGAEHHFQREGYECFPNLILLGVHLAGITKNIKFGNSFNIVPMWHPLRLAEDFAMADVMTKGRMIFGVGRGYQTREVETFGAPLLDREANRELFIEQMEIILKAFNEDSFTHKGKYYTLPAEVEYRGYALKDITLVPRPSNLPVEMWQPVSSGSSIQFAAEKGIKAMIGLTGEKIVDQFMSQYQSAAANIGNQLELGQNTALGFGFCIGENQKDAMEKVRPYHDERYKWFAPFGFVRYTDEEGRMWGTPGAPARLPNVEDGIEQKAWLCGNSNDIIESLKHFENKYPGLEDIVLQWPEGMPWLEFKDQLTIFASEVMPAFQSTESVVTPADD